MSNSMVIIADVALLIARVSASSSKAVWGGAAMIPVSSPNDAYNKLSVPLYMMIHREIMNLVRLLFCTHNSSYDVSNF